MTQLIGLVGLIGSGKGTVANMFSESDGYVEDSFAKPLKDVTAAIFGWPRHLLEGDTTESREFRNTPDIFWSRKTDIPNFTPRLALQLIGTDVLRGHFHDKIWVDSLEYRLRCHPENTKVVISDARFRNEVDLIRQMNGKIIWIQRGELPDWWETAKTAHENAISRKIMKTKYKDVHESEWNWAGYPVDYVIKNDGSIEDLETKVAEIQNCLTLPKLKLV